MAYGKLIKQNTIHQVISWGFYRNRISISVIIGGVVAQKSCGPFTISL